MNPDDKKEFDRQLADKFKDFKPDVPAGLWDRIATQLDAQESRPVATLKKKRRFPTWWISVAAAVLVVCGIAYWYNRPIPVTYLQARIAPEEEASEPVVDVITEEPVPSAEPLDIAQLKRVFAKKNRKAGNNERRDHIATAGQHANLPNKPVEAQQLATTEIEPPKGTSTTTIPATGTLPAQQAITSEEVIAAVPDIQPLVVSEEEEETLLASANDSRQPFGISNILNYVVSAVDQREEKLVTFSNDDEGSLKLDFNFSLAKNRKKKIK